MVIIIVVVGVAVFLLIPFIFKGESRAALVGPTLYEIDYTEVSFSICSQHVWRPIAGFDPLPHWERVESRSFAAFGGDDKNVPVDESVTRLQALEKEMLIEVYPDGTQPVC